MTQTVAATPAASHTAADFHKLLVTTLPRLRVQALALTRNRADADDLVQAAVTSALAAKDSFTPGTNFGAWMFRILRNRFISDVRRKRETTDIDDVPSSAFARPGAQEDSLVMRELRGHLSRLPAEQRTALVMVTVQGMSYEEVAAAMDCAVGTAKCRVFRARQTLQRWLTGEERGVEAPKVAASSRKSASSPRATRRRIAADDTGAGYANPV
ncbi:sigma-70 family RNA polymerase sigma factor [Roseomonas populi]|uniref:Sigma-70 family RNA polymerase sigma factor n=1 Tax=Roseomonas populi TaxID=3121582 RepID=A0ABT1XA57_9PROT|nr:sigma-70 family RNA polymerase sigma factor [Roseomonas pecuniae]MCR0984318.1 sigma-70 family RNA polymerase sigma factor [Roseomonas pecuniae]